MVLILVGNPEIGAHVWSLLIIRSVQGIREVYRIGANLKYIFSKVQFFYIHPQTFLSYHLL